VGTHIDERRLALERQLSGIDQRAAGLKKRRDAAFDLLTDRAATVKNQARKMLHEIEQDEMQLSIERQAVLSELDRVPATERDPALMRSALEAYLALYEAADVATRNRLNRALCEAIGSHPIIRRKEPERQRWSKLEVKWPAVDSYTPAQLRQNA
jgi:hypothetical protein